MKVGIITGASSGMGREFVYAVDREFVLDEIWVIARRKEKLEELAKECKTKVRVLAMDLQDNASFTAYKELLEEVKPEINVLINAAGYGLFGGFEAMPMEEQLGIVDLNSKSLTAMCYMSLPYMKQGDAIINLGSNSSWQPVPYINVYAATKAFVLSFSRGLGKELERDGRGIHVMCVCPGWIKTEFMDRAVRDNTIKYFDRWYTAKQVVDQAMKDFKKRKKISILGFPVRSQVKLVKFAPVEFVMNVWCKQQGK